MTAMNEEQAVIFANGLTVDATRFRKALNAWGQTHFRPLPWRTTNDPYAILIAEVMLHRTQAVQVVPVYRRFMERYPTVQALGSARAQDVLEVLYPLGLRWRADLLLRMARTLADQFNGNIPQNKEQLLSLPGVSEYIAGSVRCFAWGLPDAIIDTNTVRVIARVVNLRQIDSLRRTNAMRSLAQNLLDPADPRTYNFALLDLADRVCTRKRKPECPHCPLLTWCMWGKNCMEPES